MPDLSDELLHMAADGAGQARPLGVAEVMRRGNRRRARSIGQRSLGGLSVLGISAAIVMAGALHPAHGPAGQPASGTANTATTLTETTQSKAGTMTVIVKYGAKARGKIKMLSTTFAGKSRAAKKRVFIIIAFGQFMSRVASQEPKCPRAATVGIGPVRVSKTGGFAGSLPRQLIRSINGARGLCDDEAMQVSLIKGSGKTPIAVGPGTIMTVGLELAR